MKGTALIIVLNLVVAAAFAQKVDSANVNGQKNKGVKSKVVNGTAMIANMNIMENVSRAGDYSILLTAIKTAGLAETFESKGPITIFAPTNAAFSKLPVGKL